MITRNRCSSLQWALNVLLLIISVGLAISTGIFVHRYNIYKSGYLDQTLNGKTSMSIKLNAKLSNGQTLTKIVRIQAVNSSQHIDKVLKHSISQCSALLKECSIPDNVVTIQSDGSLHIEEFTEQQIRRKSSDGQLQSSWGFDFTPTSVVIDAPLQGNQAIEVKKEIFTDKTVTFSSPSASKYVLQIDGDVINNDDSPIVNITGEVTAKQGIYIGKNLNVEDGTAIHVAGNIHAKNGIGLHVGGNVTSTDLESIIINGTVELDSEKSTSYAIRIGKIYSKNSAGIYVSNGTNTSTTAFRCDGGINIQRDQATAIIIDKGGIISGGHGINVNGNISAKFLGIAVNGNITSGEKEFTTTYPEGGIYVGGNIISKRGPAIIVDGDVQSDAFTDIHRIWWYRNDTDEIITKDQVQEKFQEEINTSNSKIESGVILIKGNVTLSGSITKNQTIIYWCEKNCDKQSEYNTSEFNTSTNLTTTNAVYIRGDVNGGMYLNKLNSSKEGITVAGGITSVETSIHINGSINSTQGNGLQINDGDITTSKHGIFVNNGSINSTHGDGIQVYNGNITASEHGIYLNSRSDNPNGKPKKNDTMIQSNTKSAIYVEGVIVSNLSNAVGAHGLIAKEDGLNLIYTRSIYNTPITVTTNADKSKNYAINAKRAIFINGIVKSIDDAITIRGAEVKRTVYNGKYYQATDDVICNKPDGGNSSTYEQLQDQYYTELTQCMKDKNNNQTQCIEWYGEHLKNLYELFETEESYWYSLISTGGRGIYINNGLLKSYSTGVAIEPTKDPRFNFSEYKDDGEMKYNTIYGPKVCIYRNAVTYNYNSIEVSKEQLHYNFANTSSGEKCEWYNDVPHQEYLEEYVKYKEMEKTCSESITNSNVILWCSGDQSKICIDQSAKESAEIICKTKEEWFSNEDKKQKYDEIIDMLQKCSETKETGTETPTTPTQ